MYIYRYHDALLLQPASSIIPQSIATPLAVALFAIGQILVVSSTLALGITGTPACYFPSYLKTMFILYTNSKVPFLGITLASSWIIASRVSLSTFFQTPCMMAARCVSQQPHYGIPLRIRIAPHCSDLVSQVWQTSWSICHCLRIHCIWVRFAIRRVSL